MKRFKRLCSILLAAVIILPVTYIPAGATQTPLKPVESGDRSAEIVRELGIYQGDAKDKNAISRVEYAVLIAHLLGYETAEAPAEDPYGDFLKYEYASGELAYLKQNGIMLGDENNLFHPQDPIDAQSALIVGVRALGYNYRITTAYSPLMEALNIVKGIGLDKGVGLGRETIDESTLERILYNILCADYMEWEEKAGLPLLTSIWGLEKVEGIVTANDITGLYHAANKCREGYVTIGDDTYRDGAQLGRSLLGHSVTAFISKDTDEMRYLCDTNNTMLFSWEEAFTYGSFDLGYYSDSGKIVKYPLDKKFAFLYNGRSVVFDDTYFSVADAELTLIDNSGDGKYDVVSVENFTYDIVKSVNLKLGSLLCEYGNDQVQAESDSAIIAELYHNGVLTNDIEAVQAGSILKYYQHNGYNKICIYDPVSVSGMLTSISSEKSEENYVQIDGKKYTYNSCFAKYFAKTELGSSGAFLLDPYGRVSVFVNGAAAAQYGYVLGYQTNRSLSQEAELLLLTEEDAYEGYQLADRIRIDGVSKKLSKDLEFISSLFVKDGILRRQPIIYQLNEEGKISLIDTYSVVDPLTAHVEEPKTFDRLQLYYENSNIYYSPSAKGSYERTYIFNTRTVLFVAPTRVKTEPGAEYDKEQFRCTNVGELLHSNRTFDVFDIDETGTAGMAVLYADDSGTKPFNQNLPMGVCNEAMQAFDSVTGETRNAISFWYRGAFYNKLLTEEVEEIPQSGDLFQYRTNAQDEIDKIVIQYRPDGSINKSVMTSESFRVVAPKKVSGNYLCGITNDKFYSYYNMVNVPFAVYHMKTGVLESGTMDDIEIENSICVLPLLNFAAASCVIYK